MMDRNNDNRSREELLLEIERLRAQLSETEETLNAIRSGEVDALVVSGDEGEQVFTPRGAEHPYRVFIEKMQEGVVNLATDGTILYCNSAFSQMLRKPIENIIGSGISRFVSPDSINRFDKMLKRREIFSWQGEINLLAGDGTIVPAQLSTNQMQTVNEWTIYIVATDLTNIRKKEKALQESEAQKKALLDNSPDVIILTDTDMKIQWANKTALDMNPDAIGQTCYKTYAGGDEPCEDCPCARAIRTGIIETGVKYQPALVGVNGESYWEGIGVPLKSDDGKVVNVIEIARNVTKRKLAEKALQEARDELECRVQERTAELSRSNEALMAEILERKQAEHELEFSNIILSTQQETSLDGILVVDENQKIVYLNQLFIDMWDIPAEIIESRSNKLALESVLDKLVDPGAFLECVEYLYEHIEEKKRVEIDLIDGRTLDRYSSPIIGPDGKYYGRIWYFRDITEHKLAEEKLRNAHKQLSDIIEFLPDATFVIDAEKKVIAWNRATEEMTGIQKGDILGKGDYAYGVPFYGEQRPILINLTLGHNSETENKYDFLKYEGRIIYAETFVPSLYGGKGGYIRGRASPLFDGNGKWVGAIESVRDITERKNVEEALRASEEKYRNIVEATQEGIWALDKEGKTSYVNKRMAEMLGYTTQEMLGRHLFCFMDDENRMIAESKLERRKQGISEKYELRFRRRDGSDLWALISTNPILNSSGQYNGALGMVSDLSDIKKMEEIRLENETLVYANAVKSEFMAVMSHELRTPLSSVIGYAQLLNENIHGKLNEKQGHYVNNILEGSKHLLDLINSILDMAQIEAGRMLLVIEEVSVPDTIESIVHFMGEQAKAHNVILKKEINPELDVIEVDRQKFKQMMLNLLSNAIKFSKAEGGTVTIRTKKDGDKARISVSDTGIGIKKKDLERLFFKFEQLDAGAARKYEGTGLGLSITKQLVEMHGGTIMVESKFNEGSTFSFSLPIKAEKQAFR